MLNEYIGMVLMMLFAIGISVGMVMATTLLGPKRKFAQKMEPFECGETQLVSPRQRFSIKFYLVAVLFILFDIEAVFLFPWAISLGNIGALGFWSMMIFLFVLTIGFIYEWKKGALDWD